MAEATRIDPEALAFSRYRSTGSDSDSATERFAIVVEALNLTYKARQEKRKGTHVDPVKLRNAYTKDDDTDAVAAATTGGSTSVGLSRKPISPSEKG